jgi:hypothetical protein
LELFRLRGPTADLFFCCEQAGIKVVYDHYEEGRDTLGFLISFLKERISAEEKHASKLEKQASKSTGWTETGCVSSFTFK